MTDSTPPPPDAPEPLTAQELEWLAHQITSCRAYRSPGGVREASMLILSPRDANLAEQAIVELSTFRAVCRVCGVAGAAELGAEVERLRVAMGRIENVLLKCDRGGGRDNWPGAMLVIAGIVDEHNAVAAALASVPQAAGTQEERSGR